MAVVSAEILKRRPVMDVDGWAETQMPEFQRAFTPLLDYTRRADPAAPHQYYASEVTQNVFAGWLAARRGLVAVGVIGERASWPECELNAAGRVLQRGTVVYAVQRTNILSGAPA
ncbi:hypothetical protein D3C87_847980 [compost metagenome]